MQPFKSNINQIPVIKERGGAIQVLISPKTVNSAHFILGFSRLGKGETVKKHLHDYSDEGFYVLSGEGVIHFDGFEDITFGPGDAVHVPKGVAHSIENIGNVEMQVIFAASPLAPTPALGHRELTE
jgi:putative monooxygenase